MKKVLSTFLGIALLVIGVFVFIFLKNSGKEETASDITTNALKIKAAKVKLDNIPYVIEATGTLQAKDKIELYSDVQGTLKETKTAFKIGNRFKRGDILIAIDSKEFDAQINSSRSDLMNQIAGMLADMEIDYPEFYQKWENYLERFNITELTPKLPDVASTEEKLFISGKNIYSSYYSIKNLEERLEKYKIRAPFDGIVTESNVNVGTLIRSGQKIGEYTDDSVFELQLSIPASENKFLKTGTQVSLETLDHTQSFKGTIVRTNAKINQDTQTVQVIVEVQENGLKDGQYLTATIQGNDLVEVFKINNALVLENNMIYIIQDNQLKLKPIQIKNYQNDQVIVTGIEEGMWIADQVIANAYPGMPVEIEKEL